MVKRELTLRQAPGIHDIRDDVQTYLGRIVTFETGNQTVVAGVYKNRPDPQTVVVEKLSHASYDKLESELKKQGYKRSITFW